jgi:predicted RNA-binding Zn-ribbon protein involved in translation (DUF1610 family)
MDPARSEQIINALNAKGVTKPCPRCGSHQFDVVAEASIPVTLPEDPDSFLIGQSLVTLPAVIIACRNCGFLTQHASGRLGVPPLETSSAG